MVQEIREKAEKGWSSRELSNHFGNIDRSTISKVISRKLWPDLRTEEEIAVENYDICINCSKKHDNLGSQYCSTKCMNEWINK